MDEASALILDGDTAKNQLTGNWHSFLALPTVGIAPTVQKAQATPSRRDVSISFAGDLAGLSPLAFSTSNNVADFKIDGLDAPNNDSIILGLSTASTSTFKLSLGSALDLLELRPKGSKSLPDDDGNLAPTGDANKSTSLLGFVIGKLTESKSLKLSTDADAQNVVWLSPGSTYRSDMVLTLELQDGTDVLADIMTEITSKFKLQPKGASLQAPKIIWHRTVCGVSGSVDGKAQWNTISTYRLTFKFSLGAYVLWASLTPSGLSFSVTSSASVTGLLDLAGLDLAAISPDLSGVLDHVHPLQLSAGKDADGWWWRITLVLAWKDVSVYFHYDSVAKTYSGGLVMKGFYAMPNDRLLPTYEAGEAIDLPDGFTPPPSFYDIRQLSDELKDLPSILPTAIALAQISYSKTAKTLWASAKLIAPPPPPSKAAGAKQVPDPFTWDELDIYVTKGSGTFSAAASSHFTVTSPDGLLAADMGLVIMYDSGNWSVTGYAQGLSGVLLASFFDEEYREALTAVLGKINIVNLQLQYTYDKGVTDSSGKVTQTGPASSFAMLGVVDIGLLELRLFYQYTSSSLVVSSAADALKSNPRTKDNDLPATIPVPTAQTGPNQGLKNTDWRFECDLGASKSGLKVGAVLDSVIGGMSSILPVFLTGMDFPTADGQGCRSLISIKVNKAANGSIMFAFRVTISSFTLTIAQVGYSKASGKATKQLIRFAADKIPLIDKIPLLDQLPQPFEQLEYVWMSNNGSSPGLLQSEVDALNSFVLEDVDQLYYKKIVGQRAATPPPAKNPIVFQPGHHFIVINQKQAVLDHVFFMSPPSPTQSQPSGGNIADQKALVATNRKETTSVANSAPAKGSLSFKNGPLSITGVTLQYKEQSNGNFLWITMDATFTLGPITFSLLGFSIGVPVSSIHLNNLAGLVGAIVFDLHGLAFAFDKPPLLIAAGFEHQILFDGTPQREEIYVGGIGVSFPPYTFVGLGEYAVLNNFKSIFLYAKLDGPLVTMEFATISGVRLGFGYNSMVRSPQIDEITDFPFISDKSVGGAGNNPMAILHEIMNPKSGIPWISPKLDAYWFAAGLTVTAFDILTVTAVAMLAFRDSGLIVTLYADAIAQMPPGPGEVALIYVEIGMIAEMNFADGYFMFEASLAPTSFLLVPECHLYGQFAMTYWFPPSQHVGDWVFSIGGYHRKFTPPGWYPNPKRLGIFFSTHGISVTGEAYFAITPKCVMGGASLHASLSVGPVSAWLDAAFDAFINFHPLHYEVAFHISVGVECRIDFLFVHIHFSGSIGAYLQVYGPDFGGSAYVDFYLFGFNVDFGASPALPPAQSLLQFWELLHKPGPAVTSTNQPDANPVRSLVSWTEKPTPTSSVPKPASLTQTSNEEGAAFKFVLEDGSFSPSKKVDPSDKSDPASSGTGVPWLVKGGSFKFRIKLDFAISHATVVSPAGTDPKQLFDQDVAAENNVICSRPMRVTTPMKSTLTVTVTGKTSGVIGLWRSIQFDLQSVPTATWGIYSTDTDPLRSKDPSAFLDGKDATIPLAMGLIVQAPPPVLAPSLIPPFSMADASRLGILDFRTDTVKGADWKIEKIEPEQTIYIFAAVSPAEAKRSNADKWADVASIWTGLKAKQTIVSDAQDGLLAVATDLLGWATNRDQVKPGEPDPSTDTSWHLKGDQPVRLIARMTDKYLALPRMAVVARFA